MSETFNFILFGFIKKEEEKKWWERNVKDTVLKFVLTKKK